MCFSKTVSTIYGSFKEKKIQGGEQEISYLTSVSAIGETMLRITDLELADVVGERH